jgi:HK97 family phage major capsid protein
MTEISELDKVIANLQDSDKLNEMVEKLGNVNIPAATVGGKAQRTYRSPGELIVNSPGFQALLEKKKSGSFGVFSGTDPVEVPRSLMQKAAITDDDSLAVLSEGSDVAGNLTGGPGGDIIQPYLASSTIMAPGFQRLTIADLMASGQTQSNTVRYLVETSSVNAAAVVHEGADKPASSFLFNDVNEPVVKLATFLPVSEEMLEDVSQIQSYLNSRLSQFVQIKEEDQLLNGSGSSGNLDGLLHRVTQEIDKANYANLFDAIAAARVLVQTVGFAEPDAIVINPNDSFDLDTAKASTSGMYFSGGPYGSTADNPWGMRMVRTTAIAAGHVLVGAFRTQAQVFRRGGLRVDASNSHEDYFRRNLVAIRAEERLALAVYRPAAFCEITNAS